MDWRWLALGVSILSVGCGERFHGERTPSRDVGAAVGRAAEPAPPVQAAPPPVPHQDFEAVTRRPEGYSRLSRVVTTLGDEVETRSPGTSLGIAVHVLGDNEERAEFHAHATLEPASAVKIIWAGAALKRAPLESVARHGQNAIFTSSNCAAAALIDLAGGLEDVNAFYEQADMRDSGVRQWGVGGCTRRALSLDSNERANRLTARDGVSFLDMLNAGRLLPTDKKDALLSWMQTSPKSGVGGWLTARLPEPVRRSAMHKAGWTERTTTELGLLTTPSNTTYAIALLANDGRSAARQRAFVSYASCAIYKAIENDESVVCE